MLGSTPDPSQAQVVSALKRLQMRQLPEELEPLEANCDLCGTTMTEEHRHLLHLDERRMVCVCESCWALRSGDPEYRPTGSRVLWLEDFDMPTDLWARFRIPIGLAFFLQGAGKVAALYPSPVGATECELDMSAWSDLCARNPVLETVEPEAESLIVDRTEEDAHRYVIVPTDEAYRLVGLVKANWEGISGGSAVETALAGFFGSLRERGGR